MLAFRVSGDLNVIATGRVDMAARGYRGGPPGAASDQDTYQGESRTGRGCGGQIGNCVAGYLNSPMQRLLAGQRRRRRRVGHRRRRQPRRQRHRGRLVERRRRQPLRQRHLRRGQPRSSRSARAAAGRGAAATS